MYVLSVQYSCAVVSVFLYKYTCFAWAGGTCPRFAWAGGTFFPVVLLCQFLVLAGNRFWLYVLLCTWSTIQMWCCVSYFGSGGKQFLVLRTYLVYNTDRYYDRKKVLVGKKSSSHLSGRCGIIITTRKKVLVICLAGAQSLLRPEKKFQS